MRIGIIGHLKYPLREPFAGGLEMHTHLLASKLIERNHDVTVFASEGSTVPGAVAVCAPTAVASDDEAAYAVCDAREHRAYLKIMDRLRDGAFDVIQNNSLHYLPLALTGLLETPMLTTLHTPPFAPFADAVRRAAARQHKFVAVSDAISGQWADYDVGCVMIPNGVDLLRFSSTARPAEPRYAVWYGRIVPEKGLHLAIDAARMAGLPLRFAGPAHDQSYFDSCIKPRLGVDTMYQGHLDHRELSRLIGHASVFLCTPCWEEPFGLVVAEALASGVPVAAFARGAIPKILDATCGVLAAPDDVASLAAAATKACTLSRDACRLRAEIVCDAELMIDRYVDLYTDLVGRQPAIDLLAEVLTKPAVAAP